MAGHRVFQTKYILHCLLLSLLVNISKGELATQNTVNPIAQAWKLRAMRSKDLNSLCWKTHKLVKQVCPQLPTILKKKPTLGTQSTSQSAQPNCSELWQISFQLPTYMGEMLASPYPLTKVLLAVVQCWKREDLLRRGWVILFDGVTTGRFFHRLIPMGIMSKEVNFTVAIRRNPSQTDQDTSYLLTSFQMCYAGGEGTSVALPFARLCMFQS